MTSRDLKAQGHDTNMVRAHCLDYRSALCKSLNSVIAEIRRSSFKEHSPDEDSATSDKH